MSNRTPFLRRSFRELPGATTRMRGSGGLPYNPGRPLRLTPSGRQHRWPQLNTAAFFRLFAPIVGLVALGAAVFFGMSALLDDGGSASIPTATGDATIIDLPSTPVTPESPAVAAPEAPALSTPTVSEEVTLAPVTEQPTIITPADLSGAPVSIDSAAVTPIPAGIPSRTLADGSPYDPTDETVAFSGLWQAGTVLEITRLPGGPLLSEEDAALLIGKTIRVVVSGSAATPPELQLSTAAFQLLAREVEPIISVRIQVVEAPPR